MTKPRIVRILRNGQITIPKDVRTELGLQDNDILAMELVGRELHFKTAQPVVDSDQSKWFQDLYEKFAPVREGYAKSGLTEEEINEEIDAAIREARAGQAAARLS